ncbi:DUF1304 domain-containing protein [Gordonia sp. HY285]|uniref:DUF1304 domain-containing protein n=1 Tax=Gordonia liuliyuniae TaxID=2911517 RepID=A0ABS9IXD9_9ACTN|nr:DUF1304 domain-containing protein [Gordonia liuliyuniae]MCF8590236.1 DUF1304 domain-containing protein [Gordonia liuliyuniae]MCF8611853.1 DUF1304 domain-containing protein [Gordonia liuliyuniae]
MLIAGLVFAAVAAAIHVFIFYLESIVWTTPKARSVFDTTEAEAEVTKPLAFNQGFYNLFLAISIAVGIVLVAVGQDGVGATLVLAGAGSMAAAGLVLMLSDRSKTQAALTQLVPPAIGVILVVLGVL